MANKTSQQLSRKPLLVRPKKPSSFKKTSKLKKFGGNHNRILRNSLKLLIDDLLPVAVRSYSDNPKQGAAYAVTNIISEIRGTIQQLEAAVDSNKILEAVNNEIIVALRMSITRMAGHLIFLKESLPLKMKDSAVQRDMALLLDDILKEYEANMTEVITNVEIRIANAIKNVIKGTTRAKIKTRRSRKTKP